jgi:hypothetical protein
MDQKAGKLPTSVLQKYQRAVSIVGTTIIVGPVKYSGGSLEGGRLFRYEPKQKLVIAPASIWMELSMMGNWVEDAVILRWAEFTSAITKGVVRPSQVIDLLLERPTAARDVLEARKILASRNDLECVWTGKSINKKFAVDHVIPYSLWHNNSLWNLLPAAENVNGAKSDKLPTRRLVVERKDSIIGIWELFHQTSTERFKFESEQLLGRRKEQTNWQGELFAALSEAIEFTANQRGIERWEPGGEQVRG